MAQGKVVVETALDTKNFETQIERLKKETKQAYDYLNHLNRLKFEGRGFQGIDKAIQHAKEKAEKLNNELITMQERQRRINEESEKDKGQGFEKGLKSLKTFALGLFGIRTAFSALRRATNAYLSENEVTANKMNAIWVALGNALGPIIEMIANGILKLIGYLNVFLNALGWKVDLTKNIGKNTKAIKDQTKAQKELNRQTASFDEMNVMSSNTSSKGGSAVTSDAFEMPELDPNIVKRLEDMAHWLKENWDWIWKVGVALAAVFGMAKIGGLLGGIGQLIGSSVGGAGTGLLGLKNVLLGLLALETIAIVVSVVYFSQELSKVKQDNENLVKWNKSITKENNRVNKSNLEKVKTLEKGSKALNDYTNEIIRQIDAEEDSIKAHQKENDQMSLSDRMLDTIGGTRSKNIALTKESVLRMMDNVAVLQELAKEGKLTDEQMKFYNQTMQKLSEYQKVAKHDIDTVSDGIDKENIQIYNQIEALKENEKQFDTTVKSNKNSVNDLFTSFKNKFSEINKLKAKPTVEIQADTKKLSNIFDTLANTSFLGSTFTNGFKNAANKLRSLGLAKGGIVNLPGRGVRLSDVVMGEATGGQEGVVPLNNEQSMDLIGQAIAKHTAINLTINTTLDGKVIAREQKKISDTTNFATNGRGVL